MKQFFNVMFEDNLKIVNTDAEYLTKREKKEFKPLYDKNDVDNMLNHMIEIEFNEVINIDEYVSFRFSPNYHILHSAQIEFFINDENYKKIIYYSGDIGCISLKDKPFVEDLKVIKYADVAILENTYAMNIKTINNKTRAKDIEKLDTYIKETCIEKNNNLIIASFAMQRLQEILYVLYNLYGEDKSFDVPIILDSPLASKLTKLFAVDGVLKDKDRDIIAKILKWDNLKITHNWQDSEAWQLQKGKKIVLACSGFAESGRIRAWLQHNIPNPLAMIIFIGYSTDESLSGILKEGKKATINIDGVECLNKCKVNNLLSFTSHIQHNEMLELYSELNCKEIYLVHSEMQRRVQFADLLDEKIKEKCKTTKVYIGFKDLEIEL
jgi:metallo-beta-lactamase family protein